MLVPEDQFGDDMSGGGLGGRESGAIRGDGQPEGLPMLPASNALHDDIMAVTLEKVGGFGGTKRHGDERC